MLLFWLRVIELAAGVGFGATNEASLSRRRVLWDGDQCIVNALAVGTWELLQDLSPMQPEVQGQKQDCSKTRIHSKACPLDATHFAQLSIPRSPKLVFGLEPANFSSVLDATLPLPLPCLLP